MFKRSRNALIASLILILVSASANAASVPRFEREFLGIRLMSRGISVLRKYGTPTKVLVGNDALILFQVLPLADKDFLTITIDTLGADSTGGNAAPGTAPGAPGGMPMGGAPGSTSGPYAPGGGTSGPYGAGGSSPYGYKPGGASGPYGPGGSSPYAQGGAPGFNNGGDTNSQAGKYVFWVYQYPKKGITNLFVLDEEGRVTIIGQAGGHSESKTSHGIGLGNSYSDIVRVYGFPDLHEKASALGAVPLDLLHISYEDSHGARFYFINTKLRGNQGFKGVGPWCVATIVTAGD